jgi:hypothetical protein
LSESALSRLARELRSSSAGAAGRSLAPAAENTPRTEKQ